MCCYTSKFSLLSSPILDNPCLTTWFQFVLFQISFQSNVRYLSSYTQSRRIWSWKGVHFLSYWKMLYQSDQTRLYNGVKHRGDPDNKVHGANMGPTWVLSGPRWAPCWPHEPRYQGSSSVISKNVDCPWMLEILRKHRKKNLSINQHFICGCWYQQITQHL